MLRNRPSLGVTCGRCGKRREGLRHVCVSNSKRKATLKPAITFGKCPTCKRTITNPLTNVCVVKGGFKRAKSKAAKREKARAREKATSKRKAEQHPFESCRDDQCKRPTCLAYRTGFHEGEAVGFGAGYSSGHSEGFAEGLASCPGPHNG